MKEKGSPRSGARNRSPGRRTCSSTAIDQRRQNTSQNCRFGFGQQLAQLQRLTTAQLRARYADVFGEQTNANNRVWLIRRIAWRLQAKAEGDLSDRARRRAEELANDADLCLSPPKTNADPTPSERTVTDVLQCKADHRLPPPGTVITRLYKGEDLQVKVLADGFEFEGQVYQSLSAVAKAITGTHCNGYHFFRLGREVAR